MELFQLFRTTCVPLLICMKIMYCLASPITTYEPATTPITTPEPATTPITTSEPATTPITTSEPATTPITTSEPATDDICQPHDDVFDGADLYTQGTFALYPFNTRRDHYEEPGKMSCTEAHKQPSNVVASCPWDSVYDYNENRIPAYIKKARCLCENCMDREDRGCQEIKHPIKVWTKDNCTDGYQMYRMETIQVPVACICVKL
ncbi:uncharacterized protein [Amphiura filiformis]|uniref:uncharacterized protein n=1 Tax=Amphiura filiformis TaxID=82378 RepID=UPI003B221E28